MFKRVCQKILISLFSTRVRQILSSPEDKIWNLANYTQNVCKKFTSKLKNSRQLKAGVHILLW